MNTPDLSGTVAVLTGAAGGLGAAMTTALVGAGASVLAVDISEAALEDLAGSLPRDRLATICANIREPEACNGVIDTAIDRIGAIHALVNNAGSG